MIVVNYSYFVQSDFLEEISEVDGVSHLRCVHDQVNQSVKIDQQVF